MNSSTFQMTKTNLEYEIGKCQQVIASVIESTEMPEERKVVYLNYEQPRMSELSRQLAELNQEYYGVYNGYSSFGVTIGQ